MDHETRQPEMLRETIPFIILATLSVAARCYSRSLRQAALGADDYVIFLALVRTSIHVTRKIPKYVLL